MSAADVMKELILAKYNESPVDRYPQEGPLTDHILAGLKAVGYAVIERQHLEGLIKSFRYVESSGNLYDAATHRWVDLVAEVAEVTP